MNTRLAPLIRPSGFFAAVYIAAMRHRYRSRSGPIPPVLRNQLDGFFSSAILECTRICVLREEHIPDPPFRAALRRIGVPDLPSFKTAAAVTFLDVLVGHEDFTPRLLFHELVHAVQYRQLGLKRFSRLYATGFVNGGGYDGIPLEQHAYALDARFSADRHRTFSVEAEVQSCISAGKY